MLRLFFAYGAARAVPALFSLLFTLFCVEALSAEQYGIYTLTLLPTMIAASFAGALAGQPMLRFGMKLSYEQRSIGLIQVPLTASIITLPFLFGYLLWAESAPAVAFLATCIILPVAILDAHRSYLIASSQATRLLIVDSVRSLLSLIFLSGLLSIGLLTSSGPLAAILLATSSSMLLAFKKNWLSPKQGDAIVNTKYIKYGVWVAFWMVVTGLLPLLERLFLEQHYGFAAAGVYAAMADPISALMSAIGAILANATMPLFVSAWDRRQSALLTRLKVMSVVAVGAGAVACFCIGAVIIFSGWGRISNVLSENSNVAIMLLVATGIWQISVFIHKPLELTGSTHLMFIALLASCSIFILLSKFLVLPLGMMGVVISKLVAGFSYCIAVIFFVNRMNRLS